MTRLVLLLRGINLARARRVAMADLRELVGDLGYEEVRTHLQSGNVVLATDQPPDRVARAVEAAIAERLGLEVDVIVRTAAELAAVAAADPLGEVVTDPSRYHVLFLSEPPDGAALGELLDPDFAPERLSARGREVYVWCPGGMQRSPVMKALTRRPLAPTATLRNWNTVTKLLEMLSAPPSG